MQIEASPCCKRFYGHWPCIEGRDRPSEVVQFLDARSIPMSGGHRHMHSIWVGFYGDGGAETATTWPSMKQGVGDHLPSVESRGKSLALLPAAAPFAALQLQLKQFCGQHETWSFNYR